MDLEGRRKSENIVDLRPPMPAHMSAFFDKYEQYYEDRLAFIESRPHAERDALRTVLRQAIGDDGVALTPDEMRLVYARSTSSQQESLNHQISMLPEDDMLSGLAHFKGMDVAHREIAKLSQTYNVSRETAERQLMLLSTTENTPGPETLPFCYGEYKEMLKDTPAYMEALTDWKNNIPIVDDWLKDTKIKLYDEAIENEAESVCVPPSLRQSSTKSGPER